MVKYTSQKYPIGEISVGEMSVGEMTVDHPPGHGVDSSYSFGERAHHLA